MPPLKLANKSRAIFISHAAVDKDIADKVTDLLSVAMGIDTHKAVFCSSLEGLGIPPGKDFKQFIREQIQEPKLVLLLISQNYLASAFCLAEVGASWALSHRVIPLLIPPVKLDYMKAVLAGTQALKINDASAWNEVLSAFKEVLGADPNVNRWERKRDEKLAEIESLLTKQQPVPFVPLSALQATQQKLLAANEEITELEQELQRLKDLTAKLKRAKDSREANKIELDSLPEAEQFERLVDNAKRLLKPLTYVVREALYYHFRNELLPWPSYGEDVKVDDIKKAVERHHLTDSDDRGVGVNESEPKLRRSLDALEDLRKFVQKDSSEEFCSAYEKEYDHALSFTSRTFWDQWLL
jgi:hypothetical protein